MDKLNIVGTYFPALAEIPPDQLRAVRSRLEQYVLSGNPELDTRVNTPYGDLYLSPAAELVAALEIAMDRFASDLDPEAVAAGTIWNCDLVRRFLENFAAVPLESRPATGLMRLTFTQDVDTDLGRHLRFSFIAPAISVFAFRLAEGDTVHIRRVGSVLDGRPNQYVLRQTGPDSFSVDVPVSGSMTQLVRAGTTGQISEAVTCLAELRAVVDFESGVPEDSLPAIAARTRIAAHATTLTSRSGAVHYLTSQFTELQAVSPTISGDTEMVRDAMNPLGIASGGMDIHVRSRHATQVIKQRVRLNFYATQEDDPQDVFAGQPALLHNPQKILSVTWAGNATLNLGARGTGVYVFSRSLEPTLFPALLAGYSALEALHFAVRMPRSSGGAPLISLLIDDLGQSYAWFDIEYVADPALDTVYRHVTASENRPTGSRVHVRGFNLVAFDHLTVTYRRLAGTTVNLSQARKEIAAYVNQRGGPLMPYSDGPIVDAMHYAGASQTLSITSSGRVLFTAADRWLKPTDTLPEVNFTDALAEATPVPSIYVPDSSAFQPNWVTPDLGDEASSQAVVGIRNTAYLVAEADVKFVERA